MLIVMHADCRGGFIQLLLHVDAVMWISFCETVPRMVGVRMGQAPHALPPPPPMWVSGLGARTSTQGGMGRGSVWDMETWIALR